MKLKTFMVFIVMLLYLSSYGQDKIVLKNGELLGYITLVNDSVVKFKTSKDDEAEITFKRREVISYEYAQLAADTAGYKYLHMIQNKADTLMKLTVGDRLIWQCSGRQFDGRIAKLTNDQITLTYKKPPPRYVHIRDLCYVIKQLHGRDIKIPVSDTGIKMVLSN